MVITLFRRTRSRADKITGERMKRLTVTAITFFVVAAAACTSSNTASSPDAACDSISTTVCNKIKTCFPELFTFAYVDVPTCAAREKISCLNALNAKSTALTPSVAQACTSEQNDLSCDKILGSSRSPTPSCKPIAGTLAAGATCQDDDQCQSTYCKFGTDAACGACGTRVAAGEKCTASRDCEFGLVCGGNGTCVALAGAGASCDTSKPCASGLYCKGAGAGATTGSCSAYNQAGDACTGNDCDQFKLLVCSPTSKVCQTAKSATPGSACGLQGTDIILCQGPGAMCATATGGGTGTCKAGLADGASCDATGTTGLCQAPARCVSSVCTLPTTCGG